MATITFNIDEADKIGMQNVAEQIGIPLSNIYKAFTKNVLSGTTLPFTPTYDPYKMPEGKLLQGLKDIADGAVSSMSIDELEANAK